MLWGFRMSHPRLWYADCFELKRQLWLQAQELLSLPELPTRTCLAHNKRLSQINSVDIPIGQGKLLSVFTKYLLLLSCKVPWKPPRCITSPEAQDLT